MVESIVIVVLSILSGIGTLTICLSAEFWGRILALVDRPDGTLKLHESETPLIGGLAVLVPVILVSFVYFFGYAPQSTFVLAALSGSALALGIGVLDDRLGLSAMSRFVVLCCIILSVLFLEPLLILRALRFAVSGFDFGISLGVAAVPITLLMVVGFVNAANMADGMNGQLLGSVLIWSFFLLNYLGWENGMGYLALLVSSTVALSFNLRGKLFSGSAGSYAASLFIGFGAITAYRLSGAVSAIEPILWFWLPVFDCVRLMAKRVMVGVSPFQGDRNHFHHMLQGLLQPAIALPAYLTLVAAPGMATILTHDRLTGCIVLILCLGAYYGVVWFWNYREREGGQLASASALAVNRLNTSQAISKSLDKSIDATKPLAHETLRKTNRKTTVTEP